MKKLSCIFFILFLSIAAVCSGQEKAKPPSVRVTGEATITVPPEMARIQVGVVTEAPRAETAAAQNAEKLDRVLQALRKLLGENAQIKTVSYTVNPKYDYGQNEGEPKIAGYTATNIVQVETEKLDQVGKIIDSAIQAGSNSVHSLQFLLKDENAHQTKALQEAVKRAKTKAEALASSLGLKVVRILEVQEGEAVAVPVEPRMMEASVAMKAPTPVEPGTIEVRGTVTLTAEVQ